MNTAVQVDSTQEDAEKRTDPKIGFKKNFDIKYQRMVFYH